MPAKTRTSQESEAVILVIQGKTATIKDYHWSCESKSLETLLNAKLSAHGPSGADPHPDLTAAQQAANDLGGQVIRNGKAVFDPDLVY